MKNYHGRMFWLLVAGMLLLAAPALQAGEKRALDLGEQASERLMQALKGELVRAIKKDGPAEAIRVCSEMAQPLTAKVAEDLGIPGLAIKRTSLKYRNPQNEPDPRETRVLKEFGAAVREGRAVRPRVVAEGEVYHYYAPIYAKGLCLTCHGTDERRPEEVDAVLEKEYPQDRAVGFESGDLRGMFSVTIPKAAVQEGASGH
jgi:hypothetical protein